MDPYSPSVDWLGQRIPGDDLLTDYNVHPFDQGFRKADTLHRSYSQPALDAGDCGLLHPQPGFIHRAAFMTGEEGSRRYSSPSCSSNSLRSSTVSTTMSERYDTPRFSPEAFDSCHPRGSPSFSGDVAHVSGGFGLPPRHGSFPSMDCVALDEVQKFADDQHEGTPYSFDGNTPSWTEPHYPYTVEEGFIPMDQSQDTPDTYHNTPSSDEAYRTQDTSRHESEELERPRIRHRRTTSSTTTITSGRGLAPSGRVYKRPTNSRRGSSYRSVKVEPEEDYSDPQRSSASKVFPCAFVIYGCSSTFGNKNEWKRHIQTQHMLLEHWHCEQCEEASDSRRPNDFNRRDLFVQHVVRMHPFASRTSPPGKKDKKPTGRAPPRSEAEQQYLDAEAARCHRQVRQAPESSRCVMCEQHFAGPGTWEQRLEHIGRHFEEGRKGDGSAPLQPQDWHVDGQLQQYLLYEGIIVLRGEQLVLADDKGERQA